MTGQLRERRQLLAEAILGLLAAGGVLLIAPAVTIDYRATLTFFVAIFFVDLMDLRMPYGDLMPVDSSLVAAGIVLVGPVNVLAAAAGARLAVHVARNGLSNLGELTTILSRRLVVIFVSSVLLVRLAGMSLEPVVTSILVSFTFVALDLVVAQIQSIPRLGETFSHLLMGNLILQWPLLASQFSVAVLTVVIFAEMRSWGLVLILLLVSIMRQSLALFLEIRQAYRATIEALVASIEIQDQRRKGHAERVESMAHRIGLRLGLRGRDLETLGYAALLHDVDLIGVDSEDWSAAVHQSGRHASDIIKDVNFLNSVVPVLRICDGMVLEHSPSRTQTLIACVVAVVSEIDDAYMGDMAPASGTPLERVAPVADAGIMEQVIAAATALGYSHPAANEP